MTQARHELILGGAKSGKSRTAESRAARWLGEGGNRRAALVATALRGKVTSDVEMDRRIARHRADRAARLPQLQTVEAADALGGTLQGLSDPQLLIVVDCLTLWLTQILMPPPGRVASATRWHQERRPCCRPCARAPLPSCWCPTRSAWGAADVARGATSSTRWVCCTQAVAGLCGRVTLMVAGCELSVKDEP